VLLRDIIGTISFIAAALLSNDMACMGVYVFAYE
jgi:hypothetical protein